MICEQPGVAAKASATWRNMLVVFMAAALTA